MKTFSFFFRIVLFSFLLICAAAGALAMNWNIADGVLTVDGNTGDYDVIRDRYAPWFDQRESIRSCIIQNATEIGNSAFAELPNLTEVTIPEGVKTIGKYAFYNCPKLQTIQLPDSLRSIAEAAFQFCSGLQNVALPSYMTSIEAEAFASCTGLKSIVIPDGIIHILAGTFSYCSSLQDAVIPEGVKAIETKAFYHCSALTEITIPSTVSWFEADVFTGCSSLQNVTIRSKKVASSNKARAFKNTPWLASAEPDSVFEISGGVLTAYNGADSDVTIPDGVASIGQRAFEGCDFLNRVTLPESVQEIGDAAFRSCNNLSEIVMPCAVKIGNYAFSNCKGLREIEFSEKLTSIGDGAFYNNCSLKKIILPKSVKSVGEEAFCNCASLKEAEISSKLLKKIKYKTVFRYTPWLTEKYPKAVFEVDKKGKLTAYRGGDADVVLPDKVKTVGEDAFDDAKHVRHVTLSPKTSRIEGYAFSMCDELERITVTGTSITVDEDGIILSPCVTLVVPEGTSENVNSELLKNGDLSVKRQ